MKEKMGKQNMYIKKHAFKFKRTTSYVNICHVKKKVKATVQMIIFNSYSTSINIDVQI